MGSVVPQNRSFQAGLKGFARGEDAKLAGVGNLYMIATFITGMEVITPVWSFKPRNSTMRRGKNQEVNKPKTTFWEFLYLKNWGG